VASLGWVTRASGEAIEGDIREVTTAVHVKFGSEDHTSDEGEEYPERIGDDHDNRWNGFGDSTGDTDEPDNPAEGAYEHGIVDAGWATADGVVDDISDEGGHQDDPDKLDSSKCELDWMHSEGETVRAVCFDCRWRRLYGIFF